MMVTACSYLSTKWPHLRRPEEFLLRASVGRFGDRRFTALSDEWGEGVRQGFRHLPDLQW